jgi:hypothetical protein
VQHLGADTVDDREGDVGTVLARVAATGLKTLFRRGQTHRPARQRSTRHINIRSKKGVANLTRNRSE